MNDFWSVCLNRFERELPAQQFNTWIKGPLAARYPGARIKGSYPFNPTLTTTGLNTTTATTSFHFDPLDPGTYSVTVTATQGDGQSTSAVLAIPAYLLDSTITIPER